MTGVAGYTWVAVLHLWWGFSFKATLMLANITSVGWLFIYYAVLPSQQLEAVSQLHTLTSRNSSATGLPLDQGDASSGREAAAERSPGTQEQQGNPRQVGDEAGYMVQLPSSSRPPPPPFLLLFATHLLVFQSHPITSCVHALSLEPQPNSHPLPAIVARAEHWSKMGSGKAGMV